MGEQKQVGFKLPVDQFDKFEKELRKTGMSIASMMKLFISEWLYKRGVK